MGKLNKLFLLLVLLLSGPSHASIDQFCMLLEGIPLPFCQFTRYHVCNSGAYQQCQYAKTGRIIEKIDTPATGTCAQNALVCTYSRACDECPLVQSCQCKDPKPTVVQCRTVCNKCLVPGGNVDLKILCPHFCGEPDPCPTTWNKDGEILELVGPNLKACGPTQLCADGGQPGDPTNVERDCPIYQPPQPNTPNFDKCCYMGGSTEGNLFKLPCCSVSQAGSLSIGTGVCPN